MDELELKRREDLRVSKRDSYDAGSCQGCGDKECQVFEISARRWITRFCKACLQDIMKQANRL